VSSFLAAHQQNTAVQYTIQVSEAVMKNAENENIY